MRSYIRPKFVARIAEYLTWIIIRLVHSMTDLTIVTSSPIQTEFRQHGVKAQVWQKGIDTQRFHPRYASPRMRKVMTDGHEDDLLLLYVGRLANEKRLKDIKAMLERLPNARLCLVGHGPQEEELKEYFKGTKTVFTGHLSGTQLSEAFASADVFVMPSDSETLGFVVMESMASGVPVGMCIILLPFWSYRETQVFCASDACITLTISFLFDCVVIYCSCVEWWRHSRHD
jgi:sulfoquinovosyltransferase